ncbi:MAG: XrtA system polysaccharide chain length determinant [Acetobacteraceae bacterium]
MEFLRAFIQRHIKAAWRRRWLGVAAAWFICLAGWVLVALLPNQYQARAELYVDTNAILTPLLSGIAVNTSPAGQLDMLQRTLLSRPNIETLISKTEQDLYVTGPGARDQLIRRLQQRIMLGQQGADLFTIAYRNTDPKLAQRVVQTLLSIFIERATGTNHRQMENARRFLEHQLESYQQQLRAVQAREDAFRTRYMGMFVPGATGVNETLLKLHAEIATIQGALQDRALEVEALKKELAGTQRMLVSEDLLPGGGNGPIAQAEARLQMMKLQYTDDYPGVIALERQIAAMKADAARALAKPTAGKPPPGTRSVPNPVYDQLKVKIVLVEGQIKSLRQKLAMARRGILQLTHLQTQEPNLVTDYDTMNRNAAVLRKDYDELLDRLQSANIAEAADTQANKVQIQVIDPPVLPHLPVAPNRLLLVSGVLLAGLAAAVVVPLLLAQLDRSFFGVEDLRQLGLPVLGGISMLGSRTIRQSLRIYLPVGAALSVLLVMYGGLVIRIIRSTTVF